MAEYLIYNKSHWFDSATPDRQEEVNLDGEFESRHVQGDIIEIRENGFWINDSDDSILRGWDPEAYVVLKTTNETKFEAMQYLTQWERTFDYSLDNRDDDNGIYDYTITLTNLSISQRERFGIKDRFLNLPASITLLEKAPTFVRLRWTINSNLTLEEKTERRQEFQQNAKHKLLELWKKIAVSRYLIDLDAISQAYKDLLNSVGWVKGTKVQLHNFLVDKAI